MIHAIQDRCCPRLYEAKERAVEALSHLFKKTVEPVVGYFLKVCIFREAALQGKFSKWVFAPIAMTIGNLWMRCQGLPPVFRTFDTERLQKSLQFLSEFTEMREAETEDGVRLKWALFSPRKFDQWVAENGGVRDGEWIRPRTSGDWNRLQRLREFKAFEEVDQAFKVPESNWYAEQTCVLRCNGFGLSIPMDKSFIGLHLAAGFTYAVFDWREEISAKGLFQDAETIYQAVRKEGFTPHQIKPIGYCGTTYVVAHLKELHHHEGLDVVMIGAHTSLKDVIEHTMWPANRIGLLGLGAIENNGADFDNIRKFQSLKPAPASTCLIMDDKNPIASADTVPRLTEALRQSGQCELILKPKDCPSSDFDFNKQFRNHEVRKRYFDFLCQ